MKKILLVSPMPPPWGGIANWTKALLKKETIEEFQIELINSATIGNRKNNVNKISIINEVCRSINIFSKLILRLLRTKYEIVHVNTSCSPLGIYRDIIVLLISKLFFVQTIGHYRCNIQSMIINKRHQKLIELFAKLSTKNIVLNKESEIFLLNLNAKSVKLLPNFIDEDKLLLLKNDIKKKYTHPTIIYTGRISKEKGSDLIVEVAKLLPEYKFILIGDYLLENQEISNNIRIIENQSFNQISVYLKNSSIFLFPSKFEGFPNSVVEAMAAGLPIVATNVGAVSEMIEEKGGVIVKPTPKDIQEKIVYLQKNPDLCREMGIWNKEKVKKNYTIKMIAKDLADIYRGKVEV